MRFFMLRSCVVLVLLCFSTFGKSQTAPKGDCPYPVLFIHGWTGDYSSWQVLYNDTTFTNIWGGLADTIWTVNNAYSHTRVLGSDGVAFNGDDDVLVTFNNETNTLAPGCVYAIDMMNFWNENPSNPLIEKGNSWGFWDDESDSNESALRKSGPAVRKAIQAILAANPTKTKVIIAGYSMGGLSAREYLQRKTSGGAPQWWVTPSAATGHKVAKLFTVGTPHRGSNTLGNSFDDPTAAEDRNSNPDLFSEAVRDMRYSYSCGFWNLFDCPGIYLFGGDETDLGSWYWNNDVDCNGSQTNTNVAGINISGVTQFGASHDEWEGTHDNPAFPLPTNVKYTYYVSNLFSVGCTPEYGAYGCGGDGVVDDERQWIYLGGTGKTDNFLSGNSVPMPKDAVNYRVSDRITSTNRVSHVGQQGDRDFIIRGFDEGDYPRFAHDVRINKWYAGMAQIRPEKVPLQSEATNSGNRMVDSDWFKVKFYPGYKLELTVQPDTGMDMRIDVYTTNPTSNSNAPGQLFAIVPKGTATQKILITPQLTGSSYYFRITNMLATSSNPSQAWKKGYRFRVRRLNPEGLPPTPPADFAALEVFPNPAREVLTLSMPWEGDTELESVADVYNMQGQLMSSGPVVFTEGENQAKISVVDFPAGMYVLSLRSEKGNRSVRFVVAR